MVCQWQHGLWLTIDCESPPAHDPSKELFCSVLLILLVWKKVEAREQSQAVSMPTSRNIWLQLWPQNLACLLDVDWELGILAILATSRVEIWNWYYMVLQYQHVSHRTAAPAVQVGSRGSREPAALRIGLRPRMATDGHGRVLNGTQSFSLKRRATWAVPQSSESITEDRSTNSTNGKASQSLHRSLHKLSLDFNMCWLRNK